MFLGLDFRSSEVKGYRSLIFFTIFQHFAGCTVGKQEGKVNVST